MAGIVASPIATTYSDGALPNALTGKQGEALSADIHGKYYNAAIRGKVFKFNKTAVAITVIANNLVSVFTLYNPPGSGVVGEIIHTELGQLAAATIVDTLGWYFSPASATALGTFTTIAVAGTNVFSARTGDAPGNAILPYLAYTHSGTPVRVDMITSFGALTDAVVFPAVQKVHEGTLLLPPGIAMSVAASTTITTAVGLDLGVTWAEWQNSAAG